MNKRDSKICARATILCYGAIESGAFYGEEEREDYSVDNYTHHSEVYECVREFFDYRNIKSKNREYMMHITTHRIYYLFYPDSSITLKEYIEEFEVDQII